MSSWVPAETIVADTLYVPSACATTVACVARCTGASTVLVMSEATSTSSLLAAGASDAISFSEVGAWVGVAVGARVGARVTLYKGKSVSKSVASKMSPHAGVPDRSSKEIVHGNDGT